MKLFFAALAAAWVLVAGCARQHPSAGAEPAAQAGRPNIVILFADDLGWGDLGCYGGGGGGVLRTPNLDRLAAGGVRFTNFYAAQAVCSASRAALLTGCYPNRIGITGALGPRSKVGISDSETTLAEVCRGQGYATAIFGKWHLGDAPQFMPTRHGFDEYLGLPYSNDMWPMHPDLAGLEAAERKKRYPPLPLLGSDPAMGEVVVVDAEVTPDDQSKLTGLLTRRAVGFIEKNAKRPFVLYVPYPMPHVPLYGAPEYVGRSEYGRYGDIIEEIDWSAGEIVGALERAGIRGRTLVMFSSDNGPWLSYGTHAGTTGGLREGKGTSWEGGVRVPLIASCPERIPAGTVCNQPAMTIDILPTVAELVRAPLPAARIDGLSIVRLLEDPAKAKSPHEALLFYYNQNDLEAIRAGDWKLMFPHSYRTLAEKPTNDGRPCKYRQDKCGLALYNLASDPSETHDVAAKHPDVVKRLEGLAEQARADLGDALTKREGNGRRPPGRVP